MFTLTKASIETKQILKWAGIVICVLIVLYILFRLLVFVKNVIFPAPPPKPTTSFGKLTFPPFPQSITDKKFTYSINTISGELPSVKPIVKINKINKPKPNLLALNIIKDKANRAGFKNGPIKITDTIYDWTNTEGLLKKRLRINIVNYNFSVLSIASNDPDAVKGNNLSDAQNATKLAEEFLENMGYLNEDIDLSNTKTKLYSIQNNELIEASSLSNAQAIRVNFYQKGADEIPVVYKTPDLSNLNVTVVGGARSPQILNANYILHDPTDENSTYPIKTTMQAYENLKSGQAYIANYKGQTNSISVNNVYLAYFYSDNDQIYTMPVFVFEGNDGFVAYVSAITDEWVNK